MQAAKMDLEDTFRQRLRAESAEEISHKSRTALAARIIGQPQRPLNSRPLRRVAGAPALWPCVSHVAPPALALSNITAARPSPPSAGATRGRARHDAGGCARLRNWSQSQWDPGCRRMEHGCDTARPPRSRRRPAMCFLRARATAGQPSFTTRLVFVPWESALQ